MPTPRSRKPPKPSPALSAPEDWRRWVVYQIYPRSFADHDGNSKFGMIRIKIGDNESQWVRQEWLDND